MPLLPGINYPVTNSLNGPYTLLDNQSSPISIFTLDFTTIKSCIVNYSIIRNSTTEVGSIFITTDGTVLSFIDQKSNNSDTGIILSGSLSSPNIVVSYISTSTGFSSIFKYSLQILN